MAEISKGTMGILVLSLLLIASSVKNYCYKNKCQIARGNFTDCDEKFFDCKDFQVAEGNVPGCYHRKDGEDMGRFVICEDNEYCDWNHLGWPQCKIPDSKKSLGFWSILGIVIATPIGIFIVILGCHKWYKSYNRNRFRGIFAGQSAPYNHHDINSHGAYGHAQESVNNLLGNEPPIVPLFGVDSLAIRSKPAGTIASDPPVEGHQEQCISSTPHRGPTVSRSFTVHSELNPIELQ